ncbi:MAG: tetratricopeptide repeat protein, partial [Sphingomonadales bacterium]
MRGPGHGQQASHRQQCTEKGLRHPPKPYQHCSGRQVAGGKMRVVALVTACAVFLANVSASGAMPAAAQTAEAPSREKIVETWAKAHLPAVKAAIVAKDPAATAAHLRAAATELAPLSDGDISSLLIGGADGFLGDGDNASALAIGEAALAWSRQAKLGPGNQFDALGRTGAARYFMADYAGAARDMGESVERAREIAPYDANAVANAISNYAVVLDANGRYRESEAALQDAVKLRLSAEPRRPEGVATAHAALAAVQKRIGRFDLAEGNYRASLETLEAAGRTETPAYARVLHNYAVFLSDEGRDAEAVPLYRRVLALVPAEKRLNPNMIPDHSALASALLAIGALDEAEVAIGDAIRIAEKLEKPNSDVGPAFANRAGIREARGDVAGAEADYRHALAVDRQINGGGAHLDIPIDLMRLSSLLRRNGRAAEAETLSAEAVQLIDAIPARNPRRAVVLDERAAILAVLERREEALAASRAASELLAERFELDRDRD